MYFATFAKYVNGFEMILNQFKDLFLYTLLFIWSKVIDFFIRTLSAKQPSAYINTISTWNYVVRVEIAQKKCKFHVVFWKSFDARKGFLQPAVVTNITSEEVLPEKHQFFWILPKLLLPVPANLLGIFFIFSDDKMLHCLRLN